MFFHIIASGSKGNATVISDGKTNLLIDCGICKCRLEEGLNEIGLTISDINALLITHGHTDHVSGIKFLSPSICYGLEGSVPSLCHKLDLYTNVNIGSFNITPVETSHDYVSSCGFVIENKNEKLVYITDTGIIVEDIIPYVKDPDYLILECNHDIRMLLKTNRTMECKQRILSPFGHLCNEDSALACLDIIGPNIKEIVLAHISEEANSPEVALAAYDKIFSNANKDISRYKISVASQHHSYTGGNR